MEDNYTVHNQNSMIEYASIDAIEEAVDYLKNPESFRGFDQGLVELLKRKGYSGDLGNVAEMTEYLMAKLKNIGSSISKQTLGAWFSGKSRPQIKSDSRIRMYEVCFSLGLTEQETVWFFQHVYYDRAFNCHTIDEAVFYYAFLHGIPYQKAKGIISEIEAAPIVAVDHNTEPNYTLFVKKRVSEFHTEEELKEFLIANKENFRTWNHSALETLHGLRRELLGDEDMKEGIAALKRQLTRQMGAKTGSGIQNLHLVGGEIYKKCGLLMKEIFYDAEYPDGEYGNARVVPVESVMELIDGRDIYSNNFLLVRLLTTFTGIRKEVKIPYIVSHSFPTKDVISDIFPENENKSSMPTSKAYDGIRKMIILLDFYRFWLCVKLKIGYTDLSAEELVRTYCEEADSCLCDCGYEGLYQGNPYDWIFLSSAHSEAPLVYLRSYIAELDDVDAPMGDEV